MYKVMLIDDDVPMLEYLKHLLDFEKLGIQIADSVHSSELAMEIFKEKRPDIVITDIGMPHMNGITLAQTFRKLNPDVRIIFLTCHEDFTYSKQAFELNADDYLIKDEVTQEQLTESLQKAIGHLKNKEMNLERLSYRQDMERNQDILKQEFLDRMFRGFNVKETLTYGRRLGLDWPHLFYFISVGFVNLDSLTTHFRLKDLPLVVYGAYNIANELSLEYHGVMNPVLYKEKQIIFVLNVEKNAPGQYAPFLQYLHKVVEKIEHYLKVKFTVYYHGSPVTASHLGKVFLNIQHKQHQFYYDNNWLNNIEKPPFQEWQSSDPQWLDRELGQWVEAVLQRDRINADIAIHNIQRKGEHHQLHPEKFIWQCVHAVRTVSKEMDCPIDEEIYFYLDKTRKYAETLKVMQNLFSYFLTEDDQHETNAVKDPALLTIDRYINEHIFENVTSVDIANHLHLNASYFSRYFKKLTKMNFTEYVHQFKIKLAIELLQRPNETVENVAYSLGYSDRAYFSKVFKKYVGKSPSDYKA
ncbi:MAG TPA: response regulator [Bacilli bacterium]